MAILHSLCWLVAFMYIIRKTICMPNHLSKEQILPCFLNQRHNTGTSSTQIVTVIQAKAKILLFIRHNQISKVVCGILCLTPKARVWLGDGLCWQQMKPRLEC